MIQRQPESPFLVSSYVPKLARSLFPDATPEQYKFLHTLVECVTSLESRLQAVEGDRRASESVPRRARKGPDGIFPGALVHVDAAGVAWLAVNTNADRPFTHVADTIKADQVTVVGAGRVKVRCLPDAGAGDRMWVSSQPGFATNLEPTGAALIQAVGARVEQTSAATGLALVSVAGGQVSAGVSSIDATRIADGSVDNAEFEMLDGVAGNIQAQLDDKVGWPNVGAAGGVASLDGVGKLPLTQLPSHSHSASDVTSGTFDTARIPSGIDAAKIGGGAVSNAEFGFLDGVTSAIQTQLNGKAASSHTHSAADITSGTLSTARLPTGIDAANIGTGVVSNAEFGFLDGVTSGIQGQINGKQAADSDLTAIAGLATTGLIARTATGSAATRTITAGSDISVSNGDGVSGNPSIAVGTNIPRLNANNSFSGTQTFANVKTGGILGALQYAYYDSSPTLNVSSSTMFVIVVPSGTGGVTINLPTVTSADYGRLLFIWVSGTTSFATTINGGSTFIAWPTAFATSVTMPNTLFAGYMLMYSFNGYWEVLPCN